MQQLCERCRMHPADVVVADMCVCEPCASVLEWSYGIVRDDAPPAPPAHVVSDRISGEEHYQTSGIGDVIMSPPLSVARAFGMFDDHVPGAVGAARVAEKPTGGFPWFTLVLAVGGVAAIGTMALALVRVAETAREAQREGREFITKHPEVLTALV